MCTTLYVNGKHIHGCDQLADVVPLSRLVVYRADARKDVKMRRPVCLCHVDLEATGRGLGYAVERDEIGDVKWRR